MRLGQLSRQLDVDTKKIVKFLGKENIVVDDNPNTKLDDNQIELVIAHFEIKEEEAPTIEEPAFQSILDISNEKEEKPKEELIQEETKEETVEETKEELPTKIDLSKFESKPKPKKIVKGDKNFFPAEDQEEEEITKAELLPTEKVQLDGIKVVGKIDLPEKPKKETKEEAPSTEEATTNEIPASGNDIKEEVIDETHPLKKAKLVGVKESKVVKKKKKSESKIDPKKPYKGIKAKEIKAKKKAEEKKSPKKKKKEFVQKKVEPVNINREARQRKKVRQKEAQSKPEKSWWAKLWESFSL